MQLGAMMSAVSSRRWRHVVLRAMVCAEALVVAVGVTPARAEEFGKFSGPILLELLPDGRDMRVARSFKYVGPDKREWTVPAGAVTNGATIPSALWSVVGGPWEGKYRDAAVVHDHYCTTQERPAKEAHRMFYDAARARGVSKTVADLMYAAILTWDRACGEAKSLSFGDGEPPAPAPAARDGIPSQPAPQDRPLLPAAEKDPAKQRKLLLELKKKLARQNYSPAEIEAQTSSQ